MNKRGFMLVEIIIMFAVFVTALLMIFSSANNYIVRERQHAFYNDVASIYKAIYLKEALVQYSNITAMDLSVVNNRVIGTQTPDLFPHTGNRDIFIQIADKFNMHQMYVTNDIRALRNCTTNLENCPPNTFLTEDLRAFINTINLSDLLTDRVLIFEFRKDRMGNTCGSNECYSYYTWLSL